MHIRSSGALGVSPARANASTGAGEHFSVAPDDLLGRRLSELVAPDQAEALLSAIRRAQDRQVLVETQHALPIHGWVRRFVASVAPIAEDRVVWVARDITERAAAEEATRALELGLHHDVWMATIGRLAASMAHDFRNLLTGIAGCAELGLTSVDAGHALAADLHEIRQLTRRGTDLASQLMPVTRGEAPRVDRLNLTEAIRGLEHVLRCLCGQSGRLRLRLGEDLRPVCVDRGRLERSLINNLVVNARDAMAEGGSLKIRTFNVDVERPDGGVARYAALDVADTGTGMAAGVLAQLFDASYATKGANGGTGLGLWSVWRFVRDAGGDVLVNTALGRGTTFTLRFPACVHEGSGEGKAEV